MNCKSIDTIKINMNFLL